MTIEAEDVSQVSERAAILLQDSVIWDNHACLPHSLAADCLEGLHRYFNSGVTCVHVNIGDSDMPLERQLRIAAAYRDFVARHADRYVIALSPDDILQAKATNRLAVSFDVEGAFAVEDQLSVLRLYRDLGVRWILLAYNRTNRVGAGCHEEQDLGLTEFGRRFIKELDTLGIVKDCSHTGYRTSLDVLEASALPVNFSHSNPRSLVDHPRNIPDALIRACAHTGGVIGINGIGIFLGDNDNRTQTLVRHIGYVANLVGPEHVGLGLDYMIETDSTVLDVSVSPEFWPPGYGYEPGVKLVEPERIPWIAEALLRDGYSDADLKGVLGGNFMRVARQVWK